LSDVRPRKGGPYELFCYDCRRWIPNTANNEMRKETYLTGGYSHGHLCYEKDGKRVVVFGEGIPEK